MSFRKQRGKTDKTIVAVPRGRAIRRVAMPKPAPKPEPEPKIGPATPALAPSLSIPSNTVIRVPDGVGAEWIEPPMMSSPAPVAHATATDIFLEGGTVNGRPHIFGGEILHADAVLNRPVHDRGSPGAYVARATIRYRPASNFDAVFSRLEGLVAIEQMTHLRDARNRYVDVRIRDERGFLLDAMEEGRIRPVPSSALPRGAGTATEERQRRMSSADARAHFRFDHTPARYERGALHELGDPYRVGNSAVSIAEVRGIRIAMHDLPERTDPTAQLIAELLEEHAERNLARIVNELHLVDVPFTPAYSCQVVTDAYPKFIFVFAMGRGDYLVVGVCARNLHTWRTRITAQRPGDAVHEMMRRMMDDGRNMLRSMSTRRQGD